MLPTLTILHPVLQSIVCVLRARRRPFRHLSESSCITMDQASDSTGSHQPGMLDPKAGQKRRRVSDADEHPMNPAVSLLSHKAWRKSPSLGLGTPPPAIENLTIHSPSPQAFEISRGDSASPAESYERSGREDSGSGGGRRRGGGGDGCLSSRDQDFEVVFFSLRDQGGEDDSGSVRRPSLAGPSSFYDVRDVAFLDDDHLGMILSSSSNRAPGTTSTAPTNPPVVPSASVGTTTSASAAGATASGSENLHEDHFLISIPLQSPDCPYQDLSSYLPGMSLSSSESLESSASPCLLEKLAALIETEYTQQRKGDTKTGAGAGAGVVCDSSPRLTMYTLPISRSRQIRYTVEHQNNHHTTTGPYRIASNEREMKRLLSVHGLGHLTPKNSSQHTSKRSQGGDLGTHITVFEF